MNFIKKHSWDIDIAVLCIFFARPDIFKKTFEQVRKVRPRYLLLYQDGPRKNKLDDIEKIDKCRDIAENIDWNCIIHRWYQNENYGCDPSTFLSHKWAFSIVDKCIILEDDIVASKSFFYFCKELLDKYENDKRINRICGMNIFGVPNNYQYDYFFSRIASGGGWATWKRVEETWDEKYSFLDNDYYMSALRKLNTHKSYNNYLKECLRHRDSNVPHWETIVSFSQLLHSRLNIISSKNLITNIGIDANSTHAPHDLKLLPRAIRQNFYAKSYDIIGPIKHPPYVIESYEYVQKNNYFKASNNIIVKFFRRLESLLLKIKYGQFIFLKNKFLIYLRFSKDRIQKKN